MQAGRASKYLSVGECFLLCTCIHTFGTPTVLNHWQACFPDVWERTEISSPNLRRQSTLKNLKPCDLIRYRSLPNNPKLHLSC